MKTVIFEPYASGHRLHYVRIIAEAFLELGIEPLLATTDATVNSPQAEVHLQGVLGRIRVHRLPHGDAKTRWKATTRQSVWLTDALKLANGGKLLLPTASQFADVFLRWHPFPTNWSNNVSVEALFLGPGFGYPVGSWRRRLLKQLHLRVACRLPLDRYFHLDSLQIKIVRQRTVRSSGCYVVMPDPAPIPANASRLRSRQSLQIPTDGKYALLAGGITRQKGTLRLLEAIRAADNLDGTMRILLAGRCDNAVRDWISRADSTVNDRVILIDRHLSESELSHAFSASDLVLALQLDRPGSSGTVIRAVAAGLPVLVGSGGWAERTTQQFGLGKVVSNLDPKPLAEALRNAFLESDCHTPSSAAKQFAAFASESNFAAHWTELTRRQLGLAPTALIRWPDVVAASDK